VHGVRSVRVNQFWAHLDHCSPRFLPLFGAPRGKVNKKPVRPQAAAHTAASLYKNNETTLSGTNFKFA